MYIITNSIEVYVPQKEKASLQLNSRPVRRTELHTKVCTDAHSKRALQKIDKLPHEVKIERQFFIY